MWIEIAIGELQSTEIYLDAHVGRHAPRDADQARKVIAARHALAQAIQALIEARDFHPEHAAANK